MRWPFPNLIFSSHFDPHSMMSGYSRFPVHEPGKPLAFIGTLLIKKVCVVSRRSALTIWTPPLSSSNMIRAHVFRYQRSLYLFCLKQGCLSTVFKLWIICEFPCTINIHQSPNWTLVYSQTGRSHLLLISKTPGVAGGAVGIITLEDIIEVIYPLVSVFGGSGTYFHPFCCRN